jgi:Ca-activated chloride channel family protein
MVVTMMHSWFAHPWLLTTLTLLPVLMVLALAARRSRRLALASLGAGARAVLHRRRWPRRLRGLCLALGLLCAGLGAAGPQWGRDWGQSAAPGRDLVVVLDRSRSMLAETPSRLERARAGLLDLADALARRGGHRVALVTFAGRAKLVCPLTHDYDHFRESVAAIEHDALDPDLAPGPGQPSGTRIGLGLRAAINAHDGPAAVRDILLLSDGDDPARDGEWHAGEAAARTAGVAVLVIGIGDPERLSPVPAPRADGTGPGRLEQAGREVQSRLEEEPLRAIAAGTGGAYEPARLRTPPLGALSAQWIASRPVREDNEDALPVYRQHPLGFLLPAFVLLAMAMLVADRRQGASAS